MAQRFLVRFKYLDCDGLELSTGQDEVAAFDEADARQQIEGRAAMVNQIITAKRRGWVERIEVTAVEPVGPPEAIDKTAMYSKPDVARLLGCSVRKAQDLPLRWVKFGRGERVLGEDLLRYIRDQR